MRTNTLILALVLGACGNEPTPSNEPEDTNAVYGDDGHGNRVRCGPPDDLPRNFAWTEHCDVPHLFFVTNLPPNANITVYAARSRPWVHIEVGCALRMIGENADGPYDYVIDRDSMTLKVQRDGADDVPVTSEISMGWAEVPDDADPYVLAFRLHNTSHDYVSIRAWDKVTDQPADVEADACPAL